MVYLTKRQKSVYDFLKSYIEENGYAPTVKEMCVHFGKTSLNTMHKHLITLEEKGLIRRDAKKSRSVELVEEFLNKREAFEIPVLGYVTEGAPIKPAESIAFVKVPNLLLKDSNMFILIVKGNFLVSECIKNGDYILVESRSFAENGDITVIRGEEENVYIRKIFKKDDYFMLQSPDQNVEPEIRKGEELQLLGTVRGVYRNY